MSVNTVGFGCWQRPILLSEMQHLPPSSVSASRHHELLSTSLFLLKQHNKAAHQLMAFPFVCIFLK